LYLFLHWMILAQPNSMSATRISLHENWGLR
jgi:hypothetical protein